jgi:multiple sugar transport system substrate-binding protein
VLHKPKNKDGEILESGSTGWISIFKGAKNIDAAKKLIMHLLDPKVIIPMAQLGGGLFLPAYEKLWTEDTLKIDPNIAILKEIMFNKVVYTGTSYPADPSAAIDSVLSTAIPSQMMTNVTTGKMSVEEAVKDAHNKIVQLFEESGLPQG